MYNEERLINLFLDLVKIDSESGNEREIADFLKNIFKKLEIDVQEDNAGERINGNAGNLIASLKGNCPGAKLLFLAHMDTVQPGKQVQPIREEGIIKSSGDTILGGDDKAGIACIIEMLQIIKEQKLDHPNIQIIFTVGEESGLLGAKALDTNILQGDIAYVLDNSGSPGHITVQGPAQKEIIANIKGKTAHAGVAPEKGINAIQVAARGLARMKLGRIDEETTANIGKIKGGTATNIVPDVVILEGEARSINLEKLEKQCQHMIECLERGSRELGGKVEIEVKQIYSAINIDKEHQVVKIAKKAAENLGFPVSLEKSGGGSDANIINGYGIPTVNLGIGMEKVHTKEEFIKEEDLIKTVCYLIEILKVAALEK